MQIPSFNSFLLIKIKLEIPEAATAIKQNILRANLCVPRFLKFLTHGLNRTSYPKYDIDPEIMTADR